MPASFNSTWEIQKLNFHDGLGVKGGVCSALICKSLLNNLLKGRLRLMQPALSVV